jgi:thiamine-phosphate pyrophosphorylase
VTATPPFDPTLYAIVDVPTEADAPPIERVLEAVSGGVTLVQLRGKSLSARRLWLLAREMVRHLDRAGVPLIVNDRADVAKAAGARGVHLGQLDAPAAFIRRQWPDGIVGVSVHDDRELDEAIAAGASYVASGSLFPTGTKPDAVPLAADMLSHLAARAGRPSVAIGGITVANAATAARLGASGIAVAAGLWSAADVAVRARELRAAFLSGRS